MHNHRDGMCYCMLMPSHYSWHGVQCRYEESMTARSSCHLQPTRVIVQLVLPGPAHEDDSAGLPTVALHAQQHRARPEQQPIYALLHACQDVACAPNDTVFSAACTKGTICCTGP